MTIQTPDWVKNAVFYQIFPDRFARSQHPKYGLWQSSNLEPWDSPPTYQGYKGGDLWGVIEKLDYLKDLGINAIYFTPIFQSASNHRYHTHDYYQVDPMLGGNVAFDALIEEAHQRNIKVVLDGVFNHASRGFLFFNDILEHGPNSAWLNWFKIEGWPVSAYNGEYPANYVGWAGNRALPEFNHENPEVREYIMQVGEYWLKKGIDGWRLDVPFEIKVPGFWEEFRSRVKAINPEAYIVGEIWDDATQWLKGDQFDGVMNYPFAEATIAFVAGDKIIRDYYEDQDFSPYPGLSACTYGRKMEDLLSRYPWEIQLTQLNLFNSHDTARVITATGKDKPSIKLITLLMFTFPGAPSIYYGEEVGLEGGKDPDCRRTFPKEEDWDLDALEFHKQIIAIRHQYPALRTGDYQIVYADDTVYVFTRSLDKQRVLVAVNVDDEKKNIDFNFEVNESPPNKLVYGNSEISWDNQQVSLTIPGRSGCIFV
ncbi:alpha amylase catalytic region [Gloeothece citriformis PCC 7424]|uniref:Alpha amylase catalytic region n=1 Tax=Gloeothece citriformis (strain PCC 7424) TaxID=65393 RepID=B7K710_GLOC7|nr:glycoside hydrolase family 13 protein [Gloeothece citriformis]ACK72709.1 alpha amylase catalytic region [Gloeothece citriformis PCC 7424]